MMRELQVVTRPYLSMSLKLMREYSLFHPLLLYSMHYISIILYIVIYYVLHMLLLYVILYVI